jgi:hypothetical protein
VSPDGKNWTLATFRTGTGLPVRTAPLWWRRWSFPRLPAPLAYLINRVLFYGQWTVVIGSLNWSSTWWTQRMPDRDSAAQLADRLAELVQRGTYDPQLGPFPDYLLDQ